LVELPHVRALDRSGHGDPAPGGARLPAPAEACRRRSVPRRDPREPQPARPLGAAAVDAGSLRDLRAALRRSARWDPERATQAGFLVCRCGDDAIVGVFNLSEIVRGAFRSAYLGYYALAPHAGHGYMSEAFGMLLDVVFRALRLHRVEANVQPDNAASLRLVERVGFAREGYSRRYVKIAGRWRDHVRYALLADDWRRQRTSRR
jgi:ribosomal-protein-alanine N-acetyltransferase